MENNKNCPCCGAKGVIEEDWDICPVCHWEYDPLQVSDPDYWGGANKDSLNEHRKKYLENKKG